MTHQEFIERVRGTVGDGEAVSQPTVVGCKSHVDLLLGEATPVKCLPVHDKTVKVYFEELSKDDCAWWHQYVQSGIDASEEARADRQWKWPRLYLLRHLSTKGRQVSGVSMKVRTRNGRKRPVGLCLFVSGYPHLLCPEEESIFLWWLTDMPKEVAELLSIERPGKIASALLDYVLTLSFRERRHGRVGLHAASEGGDRLLEWYKSEREMVPVPHTAPLPGLRGMLWSNDGRYLVYEPRGSLTAHDLMDRWR